ncbi:MAG: cytochrome c biogenesis protein CcsA [Actinomycetota bacterium]|jgi:heme exporter protein C|nr:cytochrome c biogenesis protein CcsA [Actinomycetota bacterium]
MRTIVLRSVGVAAIVATAATVWLGLWVTPPDQVQGTLVRLLYLHPPIAWVALYLAFGLSALASLLYLWRRTRSLFWDRLAAASVEVGVVFNALTLVSGSLWGRPTWGVWWTWTARLTSTALLLVLFVGYLALRRVPADPEVRAKRCAVAALVAFVDVPIVHFSVDWWQTLHQKASVLNATLSPTIHGSMAWTLLLGFVALTLVFVWMVTVRYDVEVMRDRIGNQELEVSLAERRAEGSTGAVNTPESSSDGIASGEAGSAEPPVGGPGHSTPVRLAAPEPTGGGR